MTWLRAAVLAVLVAAAALAPGIVWRDHAREAGEAAILRVQSWRVAGTIDSRIDVWLQGHYRAIHFEAQPFGPLDDEVAVEVTADGEVARFAVRPDTGAVRPVDAGAQALVAAIQAARPAGRR